MSPKNGAVHPDAWKDTLDHQLESQFIQAGTSMPNYVLIAQNEINKLMRNHGFQKQAKQDQQEFKLAMQKFLATQSQRHHTLESQERDHFDFGDLIQEEEKMDD